MRLNSLSIIIPVYNESAIIRKTLHKAFTIADEITSKFEIIIVDDGSMDETSKIIKKLAHKMPKIKIITHKYNQGYGAAIISGLKDSRYEWIFLIDGDNQFDLREIKSFISYIKDYPICLGYRLNRSEGKARRINAFIWGLLNRILFNLRVKDINCAFKLIKRNIIPINALQSHGAMISAEILIRLLENNYQIIELPVNHYPRLSGRATGARLRVIFLALKEIFRFYFKEAPSSHVRFYKFCLVGLLGTMFDYLVLNISYLVFHVNLYAALSFGFIIGTTNNYLLNSFWTYRQSINFKKIFSFFVIGLIGIILNNIIVYFLISQFSLNYNIGKFIAVIIILLWNYYLNLLWTFKR